MNKLKIITFSIMLISLNLFGSTPPAAPTNLLLHAVSSSTVSISWDDNSHNEAGFKIFRDEELIHTTEKDITTYQDSELSPATKYLYTIKATSDTGFNISPLSGSSSQVSFTISLTKEIENNVTINFTSSDTTVTNLQSSSATFTPDNWNKKQVIGINILDKDSTSEIYFEPIISNDSYYEGKTIENISIVSHQIVLYEPKFNVVYSEFNMTIPLSMSYVGENKNNISVSLEASPPGMSFDSVNGKLSWIPPLSMENQNIIVQLNITDGEIDYTLDFSLYVTKPRLLTTTLDSNELLITDTNSSFNGLKLKSLDSSTPVDEYKIYTLSKENSPILDEKDEIVGEALLIKGNIGKNIQIILPLKNLVQKEDLLSFRMKSYFGQDIWKRIDYDYNFEGNIDNPIYISNTSNLFGIVAFIKDKHSISANKQNRKITTKNNRNDNYSTIHCSPKTWFFGQLTDLDNQICTFDENQNFNLQIYNYPDAYIASTTSIKEVASWLLEAQKKLIELEMPFRTHSALSFEDIKTDGRHGETGAEHISGGIFTSYPDVPNYALSLLDTNLLTTKKMTRTTIHHEYFHQAQAYLENPLFAEEKALWMIESTAVWFQNYVDVLSSGYAYEIIGAPFTLLSYGLTRLEDGIIPGLNWEPDNKLISNGNNIYARGIFFEMLKNYCIDFTKYIPYLLSSDNNDPTGLQHLSNVIGASQCNFGAPLGAGNESIIESSLLYYQYISAIKEDVSLINSNIRNNFFSLVRTVVDTIDEDKIKTLTVNDYKKIRELSYSFFNTNSIDSQAQTIKFEGFSDELSRCEERYIRIESEKMIIVSFASDADDFPDTPDIMLGDMKQFSFAMDGKYDFTYFFNPETGQQIYPSLYLTLIDIVDDTENLEEQDINVGVGLRRTNLIRHIDGKDLCASYIPSISKTSITVDGQIPTQFRNDNELENYIDKIKITNIESGNSYDLYINSDGTWSEIITISFTNNRSNFTIDGYNSTNPQTIIKRQTLEISR